jgi:nitroreductase
LARRFSCRAFRSDPVPRPTIERILALAQRTPSWCNSQPWQVIVTSGEATETFREALYRHAKETNAQGHPDFAFPREYRHAYLARRRESGFQLYDALGIRRGDRDAYLAQVLENFRLFGAPHVAMITTDEALGTYGAVDCGAYVGNFILAAEANGVATIPQAALATYPDFVRSHFGLAADRLVVCGISFGYVDAAHAANSYRTSRAPLSDAVSWKD